MHRIYTDLFTIRNKKTDIFLTIYLFIFIFGPPFFFKTNYLISLLIIPLFFFKYFASWWEIISKTGISTLVKFFSVYFIYIAFITLLNITCLGEFINIDNYTNSYKRFIGLTFLLITGMAYLQILVRKYRYSIYDCIEVLTYSALIETAISFLSFAFPEIKEVLIELSKKYGVDMDNQMFYSIRAFGFASSLVDLFGLAMGLIGGIALIYGIKKKKIFSFFSVLIFIAGTINARTTIVIYCLAVLICLFDYIYRIDIKMIVKFFLTLLITILALYFLLFYYLGIESSTGRWIYDGLEGIKNVLFMKKATHNDFSEALRSDSFWEMPKGFQLIFGTGHSKYLADGYSHSDIGYTNDIWLGGLLGSTCLYLSLVIIIYRAYKLASSKMEQLLCVFLFISIFVYNIKGIFVSGNMGCLTFFYIILSIENTKEINKLFPFFSKMTKK